MKRPLPILLVLPLLVAQWSYALIVADNAGVSVTKNNTPPPGLVNQWNAVFVNGGANSIYLGDRWFIAPYHVGYGQVTNANGNFFSDPATIHRLTNPVTGDISDLVMFRVTADPGAVGVTLATRAPAVGDPLTFISTGRVRSSSLVYYSVDKSNPGNWVWTPGTSTSFDYVGYTVTQDRSKLWGTNNVIAWDNQGLASGSISLGELGVNQAFATLFGPYVNSVQAYSGDSGGGVFNSDGELVGILEAAGADDSLNHVPADTVLFNWYYTIMTDVLQYAPTINLIRGTAVTVPEPGGLWLGFGGLLLLGRRAR